MQPDDEEIYISLVVVKRSIEKGQPPMDPARWAQAVVNSLGAEAHEHHVYSLTKTESKPRRKGMLGPLRELVEQPRYMPPDPTTDQNHRLRPLFFVLGLFCLTAATFIWFFLVK